MYTKTFRDMKCRRMAKSGLWLSEVGLGLWKWGDPDYDGSRVGDHEGFKILDRALELGVFHWDTANSYNAASGNSERLLGRYFASRSYRVREQVVLASKITNQAREEHEESRDFTPNESGSSRKYIIRETERCLQRLQTDYIDILYLHSPTVFENGTTKWVTPLEETWAAMDDLVSSGKVMYMAVSNRNITQLDDELAALESVASNTSRRIHAVQNWYNLAERNKVANEGEDRLAGDEQKFLIFIEKRDVSLIPFFPLAGGLLTGRYHKGDLDETGRIAQEKFLQDSILSDRNLAIAEGVEKMAQKKGCSPANIAIAWLLSHDVVPSVIAGATKIEQIEDNAKASQVELEEAELKELDELSKP